MAAGLTERHRDTLLQVVEATGSDVVVMVAVAVTAREGAVGSEAAALAPAELIYHTCCS
jgi:hypothetical protein